MSKASPNSETSQLPSPVLTNSNDAPISHSQPLQPQPSPSKPEAGPATTVQPGLRVLVVDDDAMTRTMMSRLLTRLGCNVSTAENGEIALEMVLGGGRFAVVFLDNQMPVMSGLEMVSKLREIGRDDFVVGVTGQCYSRITPVVILTLQQAMRSLMTRKNTPTRVWTSTWISGSSTVKTN